MGYGDDDVYCSPEKFGLTSVGELSADLYYEFSVLAVWQRAEDGVLFWATDSGCSCPSPFENHGSVNDLQRIDDVTAFVREVRSWATGEEIQRDDVERLVRKVRRLAKKIVETAA
ncbi:hypothetical protein OG709_29940 [Streptomyces sp. NBC_01267]|uniref:DUF7574 domain-containing protein n=1 Tax=Streptomyces sp. NBC_01267 TaxID=2903805 RepID=UPI002E3377EA|nr:hypothetical protein [Streptomyces sp. NBC_01267]